jgi:hypothetical protein
MGKYFNVGARYELVGRITNGTAVSAYMVKDKTNNKEFKLEKGTVEQLALQKQIYNCNAQTYNNLVNLKGIKCKISQLPKYTEDGNKVDDTVRNKKQSIADLKLIGKVLCGRGVSDYIVIPVDEPSKKMKLPRDLVIQLAQEGRLINAKSQMNGTEVILRGKAGMKLSSLNVYSG